MPIIGVGLAVSPLPFGVSAPPAHRDATEAAVCVLRCLHCLSAFCPPAHRADTEAWVGARRVSIAFRRSAPRLNARHDQDCMHGDEVSIAFRRSAPPARSCRQCTDAEAPPVSIAFRRSAPRLTVHSGMRLECSFGSPLPFGVLPPGSPASKPVGRPVGAGPCRSRPLGWAILALPAASLHPVESTQCLAFGQFGLQVGSRSCLGSVGWRSRRRFIRGSRRTFSEQTILPAVRVSLAQRASIL